MAKQDEPEFEVYRRLELVYHPGSLENNRTLAKTYLDYKCSGRVPAHSMVPIRKIANRIANHTRDIETEVLETGILRLDDLFSKAPTSITDILTALEKKHGRKFKLNGETSKQQERFLRELECCPAERYGGMNHGNTKRAHH